MNRDKSKRYLVFCYDQYYPGGGWSDFQGSFETLEEAKAFKPSMNFDYKDIVDLETMEVIG